MKKNSRNPKISVIVPVYNCKYYISDCIESILSQSIESIEVIIIQNGSTDGTAEIIENYAKKDNRIHVINLKDNQGVSNARNLGLEQAKGDYIAFCDGDDTLPIYAYKEMYNVALKKDADIVVGNYLEVINGNKNYIKDINSVWDVSYISYMRSGAVWNRLFKRKFLYYNDLKFSPEYSHGEDTLFIAQAYSANPVIVGTCKSVYNYMIRENTEIKSLARTYCVKNLNEYIIVEKRIISFFDGKMPSDILAQYIKKKIIFVRYYWWKIPFLHDKEIGFNILRNFGKETKKYLTNEQFQKLFFCTYDEFAKIEFSEYLLKFDIFNPKEQVLFQFKNGEIGFRYILKFIIGWSLYKIKVKIRKYISIL